MLQLIDQVNGTEITSSVSPLDTMRGDSNRQMGFAGSGATEKDQIPGLCKEVTAGQVPDQRFIDRRISKLEAIQILRHWEAGRSHLVANGSCLSLGGLCLAELAQYLLHGLLAPNPLGYGFVEGADHAGEFQRFVQVDEFMTLHDSPPGGARHNERNRQSVPLSGRVDPGCLLNPRLVDPVLWLLD